MGDFTLNVSKTVTFAGGYDCSYSVIIGVTTINGDMTIENGTATIENISIAE